MNKVLIAIIVVLVVVLLTLLIIWLAGGFGGDNGGQSKNVTTRTVKKRRKIDVVNNPVPTAVQNIKPTNPPSIPSPPVKEEKATNNLNEEDGGNSSNFTTRVPKTIMLNSVEKRAVLDTIDMSSLGSNNGSKKK